MTAAPFWQQPNNLETLVSQLLSISHWRNEQHRCRSHQDGQRETERDDGGRRVKTETERGDRAAIVGLLTDVDSRINQLRQTDFSVRWSV